MVVQHLTGAQICLADFYQIFKSIQNLFIPAPGLLIEEIRTTLSTWPQGRTQIARLKQCPSGTSERKPF